MVKVLQEDLGGALLPPRSRIKPLVEQLELITADLLLKGDGLGATEENSFIEPLSR